MHTNSWINMAPRKYAATVEGPFLFQSDYDYEARVIGLPEVQSASQYSPDESAHGRADDYRRALDMLRKCQCTHIPAPPPAPLEFFVIYGHPLGSS